MASNLKSNQDHSSHGGRRKGAGRKPGSLTKKTREIAERAIESGLTPLEYMVSLFRDEMKDESVRFEAAKAAAPYMHAKLASVEMTGKDGGPMEAVHTVRLAGPE